MIPCQYKDFLAWYVTSTMTLFTIPIPRILSSLFTSAPARAAFLQSGFVWFVLKRTDRLGFAAGGWKGNFKWRTNWSHSLGQDK